MSAGDTPGVAELGNLEVEHAMLERAVDFARAAELEVDFGESEAVVGAGDLGETLAWLGAVGGDEIAGRGVLAATDATTELMKLGEAIAVGVFDGDNGGVGVINTDLYHSGGDDDVDGARDELAHDVIFVGSLHAAVEHGDPGARQALLNAAVFGLDILELRGVVLLNGLTNIVNLMMVGNFRLDMRPHFLGGLRSNDVGLDRSAASWHLVNDGNIEVAKERELESARNRSGGHGEEVRASVGGGFGDEFLALRDAEAVLLVDDDQSELMKLSVISEESVSADDNIDLAVLDVRFQLAPMLGRASEKCYIDVVTGQ